MVSDAVRGGELQLADEALSRLTPRMFLYPALESLQTSILRARTVVERTETERETAQQQQRQSDALDNLLDGSCLRLDIAAVGGVSIRWLAPFLAAAKRRLTR